MAKGVQHFTAAGIPYNGPTHVMANGTVHTGTTHTNSRELHTNNGYCRAGCKGIPTENTCTG